jgi:hypothetical protein
MLRTLRSHLSYANVMSTIAVFIVLGGGAYAAVKLPKNSVGTKQLKNGAVTKQKLARGVATAGPKGDKGAKGDQGPAGKDGLNGTNGKDGLNGANAATTAVIRRGATNLLAKQTSGAATASCLPGERMIGGGGGWMGSITDGIIETDGISWNGPADGLSGAADQATTNTWRVAGVNLENTFAHRLVAYAICVSP